MPENVLTQFIIGLVVTLAYLWTHVSFKMHMKKPSHRIESMEYLPYIWAYVFGNLNVGKYIIHGSYGFGIRKVKLRQPLCEYTSRTHAIDGTLPAAVMILNMDRSHILTTTINHATYHPVGRAYSKLY